MRILAILIALTMLAPAALAFHRSVGGDIGLEETMKPPEEVDGPDITPGVVDEPTELHNRVWLQPSGIMTYTNTDQNTRVGDVNRTSPPDQDYAAGDNPIGYFDVVALYYVGNNQLSWIDPIAYLTNDPTNSHLATYSPNAWFGPAKLNEADDGTGLEIFGDDDMSGTYYPTDVYFYAYVFGEGTATDDLDGDGEFDDELMWNSEAFDSLFDRNPCIDANRPTVERCQLLHPDEINAISGDGKQPAICGWNPGFHSHPNAPVTLCRDFDFQYLSMNPDDRGTQNQADSPAWVQAVTPGWYGNIAFLGPNYSYYDVFHFTVGAAWDPAVEGENGIDTDGSGLLDCVEPGFDVVNNIYLAHDLDIYAPTNKQVEATHEDGTAVVNELLAEVLASAGPVQAIVNSNPTVQGARAQANDTQDEVNAAITAGVAAAFEERDQEPSHPDLWGSSGDNQGTLKVVEDTKVECVDDDGEHDAIDGLVREAEGTTWKNWLEAWIYVDGGFVVLDPFVDAPALVNGDDEGENAGGGVTFFFQEPDYSEPTWYADQPAPVHRPALAQWSPADDPADAETKALYDAYYDTAAESGADNCGKVFGNCMGDDMHTQGYRDPTSLVWVLNVRGPVAFIDWDELMPSAFFHKVYTDSGTENHCYIGASRNVFEELRKGDTANPSEPITDIRLDKPQVINALLKHIGSSATVGADQQAAYEVIRQELCNDADTLDYFPGMGFREHDDGNSLSNPLGWMIPTGWVDDAQGSLDVYYVLSVDNANANGLAQGFTGDKLDLNTRTIDDETVVEVTDETITFVWQDHTPFGNAAI